MVQDAIYLAGTMTIVIAILHTQFYGRFAWRRELKKVSEGNRKVLYTIHLALLLLFFLIGVFTLLNARGLVSGSRIALSFNFGCSLFWSWRFIWQLVYFRKTGPYRAAALFFTVSFIILAAAYAVPLIDHIL